MVKQYDSYSARSLSLSLLLMASSLIFVVSYATDDTKLETPILMEEKTPLFAKRHVRITNDLGDGKVLKIHCKSKDDDLGIHSLTFHNTFQWEFRDKFLANTEFYCYMWWGEDVTGSFDVYIAKRDENNCTDCKWSIRTDGAYWFNRRTNSWDIMYRWPKP